MKKKYTKYNRTALNLYHYIGHRESTFLGIAINTLETHGHILLYDSEEGGDGRRHHVGINSKIKYLHSVPRSAE